MWIKKYVRVHYKIFKKNLHRSRKLNLAIGAATIIFCMLSVFFYKASQDDQKYISTFTQWQYFQKDKIKEERSNYRSIASAQCSFNQFNIDLLKSEVALLESKYQTGTTIEGNFHGLNFKELPSIGAQMIADHRDLIGPKGVATAPNFKNCKSVPCVLNKIYNDPSQISGYTVYYWYLKTGSMLSVTNFIPEQENNRPGRYSGQDFGYGEFLFNPEELKRFYYLAKSLPEKLTFIPLFKSIHRIPAGAQIEMAPKACSIALPNGQILLHPQCLGQNDQEFFINVTREIAKYVDRQEGLKYKVASVSSTKFWTDSSSWQRESKFDPRTKKLHYRWKSRMAKKDFVDTKSQKSPAEQFASLVAYYRFAPQKFMNHTPQRLAQWIKTHIFHDKVYDPSGLYKQFIHDSVNQWSIQEVSVWNRCLKEELKEDQTIEDTQRELASALDHPLYECVERNIPGFIDYSVSKIQKNNYHGCQFFNDETYGHQASRFYSNINKYLMEKVLQRKLEIKRHGSEVPTGYAIKEKFIRNIDPKAVFIDCFTSQNQKQCYEKKLQSKVNQITFLNPSISNYYKKIIEEDILSIYPFGEVKKQTNEATKHFLAPYNARLNQAAVKMWDNCKLEGSDEDEELAFPLKFSGGKHYVNPRLINCLNESLETEIYKLAELKAFHRINNEIIEFKLKFKEQQYALTFLEGTLLQTLNNILDKEYLAEKIRFAEYFKEAQIKALTAFSEDKETFFTDIFSFQQVQNTCLKKVVNYYPKNYFYHPKPQIDIKYGKPVCQKFVNLPSVKKNLTIEVNRQWNINKEQALNMLIKHYESEINVCTSDFPKVEGREPSSVRMNMRNKNRRDGCLEDNFAFAIENAISEWKNHKNYQHFSNKENQLYNHLKRFERKIVSQAQNTGKVEL